LVIKIKADLLASHTGKAIDISSAAVMLLGIVLEMGKNVRLAAYRFSSSLFNVAL